MTWRLFAAVVPPAAALEPLVRFADARIDHGPQLRWTLPASWHLTLAFLPEVPQHRVDDLIDQLGAVGDRTPSFPVTLQGAGAFPDPDQARVLWLGMGEGSEAFQGLARRCRTAASRAGIPVEGGAIRPHLSLARANGISATRWLRVFDAVEPISWQVQEFALIRSLGLPGGAGYETLAEFGLTSTDDD